jgi:hypothetical protein
MATTKPVKGKAVRPPSKKLMRAVSKGIDNALRELYRTFLRESIRTLPPEFQDWGVIKSRAWVKLDQRCRREINKLRPKVVVLCFLTDIVKTLKDWDIDRCAEFLNANKLEIPEHA